MNSEARKQIICHVSTAHLANDSRIFVRECRSLAKAGYHVHLIARNPRDEIIDGVHIHGLPEFTGRLKRVFCGSRLILRKIDQIKPALIHFHDPELLLLAGRLKLRGKVVYDVHENVSDQILHKHYLPAPLRPLAALAYRCVERLRLAGMPTVHVLDSIAQRYPEPKVVLRNLAVLEYSKPGIVERDFSRRPLRLIYLGGMMRGRCALQMVELAGDLRRRGQPIELRMIGPIEDGLRPEIDAAIRKEGILHAVTIIENIPYEQAQQELSQADVGLCLYAPTPNNLNSLPTKMLEYMMHGLPVVASNFDRWREYALESGAGIMVDPLDRPAVSEAVASLLVRPDLMTAMSRAGREAVRQRYCWEAEVEKMLAFYESILEKST